MSDKRYKTIGQVGRELDLAVINLKTLIQTIAALEERVTELEGGDGGDGGDGVDLEVVVKP
jgi:hypothetical protein